MARDVAKVLSSFGAAGPFQEFPSTLGVAAESTILGERHRLLYHIWREEEKESVY